MCFCRKSIAITLEADNGAPIDLHPHIIAGLSYLINSTAVGIEPMLLYRGAINQNSAKGGDIDLALRFHFLRKCTLGRRRHADVSRNLSWSCRLSPNEDDGGLSLILNYINN